MHVGHQGGEAEITQAQAGEDTQRARSYEHRQIAENGAIHAKPPLLGRLSVEGKNTGRLSSTIAQRERRVNLMGADVSVRATTAMGLGYVACLPVSIKWSSWKAKLWHSL